MAIHVGVQVGNSVRKDLRTALQHANEDAVARSLQLIQEAAQAAIRFRSKTHKLEQSIKTVVHSSGDGEVYLDEAVAPYAPFVHQGTGMFGDRHRPINITPNGRALHWSANGRQFFASRVMSPGQQGDPFLYDAVAQVERSIEGAFDRGIDIALKEAGW